MISENYYLAVNMHFRSSEKKIVDENDKENPIEIDINTLDGKKAIFKREVEEWLLFPIKELLDKDIEEFQGNYKYRPFRYSIFILFGLFAYIEKIELYRGNGTPNDRQSTKRLVDGMKRIFTNLKKFEDKEIKDILRRTRHNLMHQAMIGDDVLLNLSLIKYSDDSVELDEESEFFEAVDIINENGKQEIRINPIYMYLAIKDDFEKYLNEIYNDNNIKNKFTKFFDEVYKDEINWINLK